ncbi:hypothetical protein E4U21_003109 [Claviceps maximensis]|nr:hypothetical protein E4U21_003109 [Claviceps maximensis]
MYRDVQRWQREGNRNATIERTCGEMDDIREQIYRMREEHLSRLQSLGQVCQEEDKPFARAAARERRSQAKYHATSVEGCAFLPRPEALGTTELRLMLSLCAVTESGVERGDVDGREEEEEEGAGCRKTYDKVEWFDEWNEMASERNERASCAIETEQNKEFKVRMRAGKENWKKILEKDDVH